jgi:5-methylcytosine-specific restriction enzyme subunit McrC
MSSQTIHLTENHPLFLEKNEINNQIGERVFNFFSKYIDVDFPSLKTKRKWILNSSGWAGSICVDHYTTIILQPKIGINNILVMWEYAYKLRSFEIFSKTISCDSIIGFYNKIAWMLSKLIIERCKKGLYRSFVDVQERTSYIVGRINMKETLYHPGTPYLQCEYQENTANNIYNQILLWTLEVIRRTEALNESRAIVLEAHRMLAGMVDIVPHSWKDCVRKDYNTLNMDYSLMHSLCRFIMEFASPNLKDGNYSMLPYVINMSRLYELFVAEWLKAHTPKGLGVIAQDRVSYGSVDKLNFKIDLVLYAKSTGAPLCVIDTKYKLDDKMANHDVHQIIAYMEVKKCSIGILLYPSNKNSIKPYPINSKVVYQIKMDLENDIELAGRFLLDSIIKICQKHNAYMKQVIS